MDGEKTKRPTTIPPNEQGESEPVHPLQTRQNGVIAAFGNASNELNGKDRADDSLKAGAGYVDNAGCMDYGIELSPQTIRRCQMNLRHSEFVGF